MIEYIFIGLLTTISLTTSSDIIEPCELDDYACISYVLSINSGCDPLVWGSVPSEVGFVDYEFQGAYFNATYFDQNAIFKNLGKCKVSAFFFNLNSNVAVLAIDCPNLVLQARRALIQHQDLGQDRYFAYQYTQRFLPLSMTVNLRPADRIDLCDSVVFTYLDGIPKYEVQPDDAATAEFLSSAENDMPRRQDIFVREEMRYYGQQLFKLFVNYILCDFRLGCTE